MLVSTSLTSLGSSGRNSSSSKARPARRYPPGTPMPEALAVLGDTLWWLGLAAPLAGRAAAG